MARATIPCSVERLLEERILAVGAHVTHSTQNRSATAGKIENLAHPSRHVALIADVAAVEEIRWTCVASGPFDVIAEAIVHSVAQLRYLLPRNVGQFEGVTKLRIAHILDAVELTFDWLKTLCAGDEAKREEAEFEGAGRAPEWNGHLAHQLPGLASTSPRS